MFVYYFTLAMIATTAFAFVVLLYLSQRSREVLVWPILSGVLLAFLLTWYWRVLRHVAFTVVLPGAPGTGRPLFSASGPAIPILWLGSGLLLGSLVVLALRISKGRKSGKS